MYYFILEQPKNRWQSAFQNKVIANLEDLQIVGEVAKANPIQKPEELCDLGLKKGYHTIVIIGSDNTISTLGAQIAEKKATMGIIPMDQKSSFYSLIGSSTWETACQALPKRRVETFDLGRVGREKFFLTYVTIKALKNKKPTQIILKIDDYKANIPALEVTIANGILDVSMPGNTRESFSDGLLDIFVISPASKAKKSIFSSIFKSDEEKPSFSSLFHADEFKIASEEHILDILSPDNKILAKTPIEISIVPNAVKIIVKKTINP